MPIGFLTDAERERLDSFPAQIVPGDLETYFTLTRSDRVQIPRTTSAANGTAGSRPAPRSPGRLTESATH